MSKVLGILNFEPSYVHVEGLEDYRPISASSFLGRYRVCDFMISNFTNSLIDNIHIHIKNRPRSMIEHVNRTNYNINTKKGHIVLLTGEKTYNNELYNNDVASLLANYEQIERDDADYVVIAPSHFVYKQDFNLLIRDHIESQSDITVLYQSVDNSHENFLMCDVLKIGEDQRITHFSKNRGRYKNGNISLETYVMSTELLRKLLKIASETSSLFSLSDVLADNVDHLKITAFKHYGPAFCISTLKEYFEANMKLKNQKNLSYFSNADWPVYTMTNDSCPTLYKEGSVVSGSVVGNGCIIEGTVINSVIGRNVNIKKGAVIKDSIILPNAKIGKDVHVEYAVIDRYADVNSVLEICGSLKQPFYVKRGDNI